jgi:hypothetical protein
MCRAGGDAPYYRIRDYNVTGVSPLRPRSNRDSAGDNDTNLGPIAKIEDLCVRGLSLPQWPHPYRLNQARVEIARLATIDSGLLFRYGA